MNSTISNQNYCYTRFLTEMSVGFGKCVTKIEFTRNLQREVSKSDQDK